MVVLANVAIPTVAPHLVILFALLLPVALIEAIVLARTLGLKYGQSVILSIKANAWSTAVGIPLGYLFALVGIIPAGLFSMLLPDSIAKPVRAVLGHVMAIGGTIPNRYDELGLAVGTLIVMIPYFLMTLRVERKTIIKARPVLNPSRVRTAVFRMNALTYAMLVIPVLYGTYKAVMKLASTIG